MLIRPTVEQTFECIPQEQHALLSGLLAAAWAPSRLSPALVQTIGLHDTAWRPADADPQLYPERGLPHDFITYPMTDKIALYTQGIDLLEGIDPWVATMVSRHYTTFSGTEKIITFQDSEAHRRERLEKYIPDERLQESDEALGWVKFFDIFSLYICLSGPRAIPTEVPRWLKDPDDWARAPDGVELRIQWTGDDILEIAGWPFSGEELRLTLYPRVLNKTYQTQADLDAGWRGAELRARTLTLSPAQ